ncbi:MAG: hypothetical protein ACRCYP_00995 [Alphaproteobacteria bacterium]
MLTGLFRKALTCHLKRIHARLSGHFFDTMGQACLRPVYVTRKRRPNSLGHKHPNR